MNKPGNAGMEEFCPLNDDELKCIAGGSIADYLFKFASWGAGYFFRMGVQEGRKMRALL